MIDTNDLRSEPKHFLESPINSLVISNTISKTPSLIVRHSLRLSEAQTKKERRSTPVRFRLYVFDFTKDISFTPSKDPCNPLSFISLPFRLLRHLIPFFSKVCSSYQRNNFHHPGACPDTHAVANPAKVFARSARHRWKLRSLGPLPTLLTGSTKFSAVMDSHPRRSSTVRRAPLPTALAPHQIEARCGAFRCEAITGQRWFLKLAFG
jgi:hypothetical protein